jgi:periplasmic protein CpxP/Spy
MTIRRTVVAAGVMALALAAPPARAQRDDSGQRPVLERMVRQRWLTVVRNRLGLNDAQLARLMETNRHFSAQRQSLNQAERGIRQEMRGQLTGAIPADDKRLATLIDSLLDLQRQRVATTQAEQRELATYLSPLQRVRFLALQEQLHQRMEQLRRGRQARRPDAPPDSSAWSN